MEFIQSILGLGASVVIPIIIFLIGIAVKMKPIKALRAGMTIGVGFIGITMISGMVGSFMSPIIAALQETYNLSLDTYDLGWPVASGIAFSNGQFVSIMFIVLIAINLIMLAFKWTKTLNVDIWNFWHFIEGGMFVYILTGNIVFGAIAGGLYSIIALVLGDKIAPIVHEYLGFGGVAITTQSFSFTYYVCLLFDKILDKIPGINKINFSLTKMNPKVSFLAEPIFLGFILGFVITMMSGMGWQTAMVTGMGMSGVMFILPRMVKILMEGLSPISSAAQKAMKERFPDREIYIGMDSAITLGDKEVITLGTIMMPITLFLAMVLPGNRILPFIDLTGLIYWVVPAVLAAKRNSFRAFVMSFIIVISMLYISSDMTPIMTEFASSSGLVDISSGPVSAFCVGAETPGYIIYKIAEFIQNLVG